MTEKEVAILRIGHRPERDQRVTTHVALTGRALGASGMFLATSDKGVVQSVLDVADRWGGNFFCKDEIKWRACIKEWKANGGKVVHLTMYGINLPDILDEIQKNEKVLVVVGAEKVPGEMYGLADYNVAVTSQPHSEIAGLALFLDRYFNGTEFSCQFPGAKIRVIPSRASKQTEEL